MPVKTNARRPLAHLLRSLEPIQIDALRNTKRCLAYTIILRTREKIELVVYLSAQASFTGYVTFVQGDGLVTSGHME